MQTIIFKTLSGIMGREITTLTQAKSLRGRDLQLLQVSPSLLDTVHADVMAAMHAAPPAKVRAMDEALPAFARLRPVTKEDVQRTLHPTPVTMEIE